MADDEQAHLATETFRMLADLKIKLLRALLQGESSVTCLADLTGVSPTSVSPHLAKLRWAASCAVGARARSSTTTGQHGVRAAQVLVSGLA